MRVARLIARVPATLTWLAVLAVTTVLASRMTPSVLHDALLVRSTNLDNLDAGRWQTLVTSAWWVDDPADWFRWLAYLAVFGVALEWWIGTRRWLLVVAVVHIVPTLVSEGVVALMIHSGRLSGDLRSMIDVGVSYGVVGMAATLTGRMPTRWLPWAYAAVLCADVFPDVIADQLEDRFDITDLGHPLALALGFGLAFALRRTWRRRPTP